jgi:hypothetical protein
MHWWFGPHNLPGSPRQSASVKHSTHNETAVLHTGATGVQLALFAHPGKQRKTRGLQIGAAAAQSASLVHATHVWFARWHFGRFMGQSLSATQGTHLCVAGSQAGLPPEQSADVLQPTHSPTPDDVSQMCAPPEQSAFVVQAAWQVLSPGQHDGVAAAQSLLFPHSPQVPAPALHAGASSGQSAFEAHPTHPSAGSQ